MNAETKAYIEQHIDQIENNGLASIYLRCPLCILNDFNNTLHYAGIDYPLEIHNYVVVCCYIATRFKDVGLHSYDFDYKTEKEEFEFICYNSPCNVNNVKYLNHDLSVLLPLRFINVDIEQQCDFRGTTVVKIHVEVN